MRIKKSKSLFILFACVLFSQWAWSRGLGDSQLPPDPQEGVILEELAAQDAQVRRDLSASGVILPDSLLRDSLPGDTVRRRDTLPHKPFLDDIIVGKNKDSLQYNIRQKTVYIYEQGEIQYRDKTLKADYMSIDMNQKEVFAHGRADTTGKGEKELQGEVFTPKSTRPEFLDGPSTFAMDTITYNLNTEKARIKGLSTQEGEGFLRGERVKKMPDNTINIAHGTYTTCDLDHPHYFLAMTKSKTIPHKKSIFGPSYMVMEDVPLYFLGLPFGFFPMTTERKSGLIVPTYGEERVKGFFLRDGGYYWAASQFADFAITGGIYTLGSWESDMHNRYMKRYRYNGNVDLRFAKTLIGEPGETGAVNTNDYRIQWTHAQDPKFRPNSTLSATVNYSSAGFNKYASPTLNEYLNTQTNSSVAYSKSWPGKPFALSSSANLSQNARDTTLAISLPNINFNVSRIKPFARREAIGKERWYEKVSFTYTGSLKNSVSIKQYDLFTPKMMREMRNGVDHSIPIITSMNILKYVNFSPTANYNEHWHFRKMERTWDPNLNAVVRDTTYGFYRLYDYNIGGSFTTKIYGTYLFPKGSTIQAIRHMLTPNVSLTYTPDFGTSRYGFYRQVQVDSTGTMATYSPFEGNAAGIPGSAKSAMISFRLQQTLEMKVRNRSDTTGTKKIKVIDDLSLGSSYNLLADSLNLAPFTITLRTQLFKNVGLNINATLDPYQINSKGMRINQFMLRKGSLGRITSANTAFGYTFNSSKSNLPVANDINSGVSLPPADMFGTGFNELDANTRRQILTSKYYDFDIPWNLGVNYAFNYTNTGLRSNVVQTLGFNGSVTLTQKWGINFTGGYDLQTRKVTPGQFSLARDLHCWQMSFVWVPVGFRQSWSFNISVKASSLKDLKYDRHNSFYDNLLD